MTSTVEAEYQAWSELVQKLQDTEHAAATLASLQTSLASCKEERKKEGEEFTALKARSDKEFGDWKEVQERTSQRFWTRFKNPVKGGQILSATEEKEEREFAEAFAAQNRSEERMQVLKEHQAAIEAEITQAVRLNALHISARQQLNALYTRVFGGPTPEFEGKDRLEAAVKDAEENASQIQGVFMDAKHAKDLLDDARTSLDKAMNHVRDVRSYTTGGRQTTATAPGSVTGSKEQSALMDAQASADRAILLSQQAGALNPELHQEFGSTELASANTLLGVSAERNAAAFQRRIMTILTKLQNMRTAQSQVNGRAARALRDAQVAKDRATAELATARQALESRRHDIMKARGQGHLPSAPPLPADDAPPPAYTQ